MEVASRIIGYLNEKTGSRFREVESHLKLIDARLAEPGVDEEGVRQMIDRQCERWGSDPKMAEYLRPQTLFGKEKFGGYYDMRNAPVVKVNGGNHGGNSDADKRDRLVIEGPADAEWRKRVAELPWKDFQTGEESA